MSHARHIRERANRGLVHGREVVQVQHVGVGGTGLRQRPLPRGHQVLERLVVHVREDAVGRIGAVLERRVHRRVGAQRIRRVDGVGVVEAVDVEALEESVRVRLLPARPERAGHDCHVPAGARKEVRQVADHVRGAAAGEEHERDDDARASHARRS
jgi:hypothetical protein